jgi:heme O synthase-like polyprenyltransferase
MAGEIYLGCALIFGLGFIYLTIQLYKSDDLSSGIKVFAYSIFYLFILFAALISDKKVTYG